MEKSSLKCPECGSPNLIHDFVRGEIICGNCGTVIEEEIDEGPEWRAFTFEEYQKRTRTGPPPTSTLHHKGFLTHFIPNSRQMWHLRKWEFRLLFKEERGLINALKELKRLSDQLGLPPSVREEAALIYRRACDKKLTKGRSTNSMVAAALYIACRRGGIPITLEEIAKSSLPQSKILTQSEIDVLKEKREKLITNLVKKEIGKCYRLLLQKLNLSVPNIDPTIFIPQIASKLKLSEEIQENAREIVRLAQKKGIIVGKNPKVIAATALYLASLKKDKKSQREVVRAAGVTEVSIRNISSEIERGLRLGIINKGKE